MTDPKQARCWNPEWKYVPANSTDIRKRFDAIRQAQQAAKQQPATVTPLRKAKP